MSSTATAPEARKAVADEKTIFLVAYPKIVFMYPTMIAAFVAAIYMHFFAPAGDPLAGSTVGVIFLAIACLNAIVLTFDFPRTTSLTLLFFGAAVVMGFYLLFITFPNVLPAITGILQSLNPVANATFYYVIGLGFCFLYLLVAINAQFDYWEVRPNELLHHHGFLSDLERISAPNMRISKEINDLFEYLLLGSGRLILQASNEPRAIVLENVLFIGAKEEKITRMLGALQVQVREE